MINVKSKMIGDRFNVMFGDDHALRTSEATESSVGDSVGLAATGSNVNVRDEVRVFDVGDGTISYSTRDVKRITGVDVDPVHNARQRSPRLSRRERNRLTCSRER